MRVYSQVVVELVEGVEAMDWFAAGDGELPICEASE